MDLKGVCLANEDTPQDVIDELVKVAGHAFLDEPWTHEMLVSMEWIEQGSELERNISDGIFRGEIEECIERDCPCIYYTPDLKGVMVAYLSSELVEGITWNDLEETGFARGAYPLMDSEQLRLWNAKEEEMDQSFIWDYPLTVHDDGSDFLHILSFAVAPDAQGTGVASRLMKPFLLEAEKRNIPLYLECLSDRLESLYSYYGFEVVERRYVDGVDVHERIMAYNKTI